MPLRSGWERRFEDRDAVIHSATTPTKQGNHLYKPAIGALVGLASLSAAQSASAIQLCDNFGVTWDLAVTGDTLEVVADTQDIPGCGELHARGMFGVGFGGNHFVVTSMHPLGSTCQAVIWDGLWTGFSGPGTWNKDNGLGFGPMTLTNGACPFAAAANAKDHPAR